MVQNDISYSRPFGFQKVHSTDHSIIQLVDQSLATYKEKKFRLLGIFIDFGRASDRTDNSILMKTFIVLKQHH